MANICPPAAPPLIDNPLAPEVFADEATGFFLRDQTRLLDPVRAAGTQHRAELERGADRSAANRLA